MSQRLVLTRTGEGDTTVRRRRLALSLIGLALLFMAGAVAAQWQRRGGYREYDFDATDGRVVDRQGVPEWQNDPEFKKDVFTFVRIRYRLRVLGRAARRRLEHGLARQRSESSRSACSN